jgi:hypothetical protein
VPLTDEFALLQSYTLRVQLICKELQLLLKTLVQFDQQIAKVFEHHTDRHIFQALPGAGPVLGPRLLASMGSERERYAQPENLQSFSGVAPVTKQSGGKCHVHRRYCCPKFLRRSFHEYAKVSILHSHWAAAYYFQQCTPGGSPSHRGPGAGLQMAADHLEMLAEPHAVQGSDLRSGVKEKQKPLSRPARSG